MRFLRLVARLFLLSMMTGAIFSAWLIGKLVTTASPRLRKRWRRVILLGWARMVSLIASMRVEIKGPRPEAPFFLVANHLSYTDIIAFATQLDCVFIAKSDIADWPVLGRLAKSVGTIFIDRSHYQDIPRVISLIEQTLEQGYGIVLFPEGTSSKGDQVLAFHPGLLEPLARMSYPVSFASISYNTPPEEKPAYLAVCWWGDTAFVPHFMELLRIKRFSASIRFGEYGIRDQNRKTLARNLRSAVSEQFVPIVSPEEEYDLKVH
jgi:1-acyl-sn-glycerol-3-phosphate acyltransferase